MSNPIEQETPERPDDEEFEHAHREEMRAFAHSPEYHYAPERRTGEQHE